MDKIDLNPYRNFFTEYTELRAQENRNIYISLINGNLTKNINTSSKGISARVYQKGSWGFSSSPNLSDESIKKVIDSATYNASFLHNKEKKNKSSLPSASAICEKDFTTKKNRKTQKELIDFLYEIDTHINKRYNDLISRTVIINTLDMEKNILTSDKSKSYSMIPRALIYIIMNIEKENKPYELLDVYGGFGQFEDNFDSPEKLHAKLEEQYTHLKKKANGIYPQTGYHDVILDADLAGILSHEAIGHTTEADIVKGGSIAGDNMDKKVASEIVTLIDYANTADNKLCPVPVFVDDEGTESKDAVLIKNGVLKGFMHNKESALDFKMNPTGNARAYKFSDEPLIRMRNTAIVPGKTKLGDMINSVKDGYYLMKASNGQADSTSEFMFGIVMGYEIKKGKLGRGLKDTTISGVALDMLKTVTMISNDMSWSCSGMCGKKQLIPVGMGGPAIKCKINIGGR